MKKKIADSRKCVGVNVRSLAKAANEMKQRCEELQSYLSSCGYLYGDDAGTGNVNLENYDWIQRMYKVRLIFSYVCVFALFDVSMLGLGRGPQRHCPEVHDPV